MVFLVVYFFWAALLLLVPIVWVTSACQLARHVGGIGATRITFRLAIFLVGLSPFFWIGFAWLQFSRSCESIQPLVQNSVVPKQETLLLRDNLSLTSNYSFTKQTNFLGNVDLEKYDSLCFEFDGNRIFADPNTGVQSRYMLQCGEYKRSLEPVSKYALSFLATESFQGLGFNLKYQVMSLTDSTVVAEASEAVFGKGLLSHYFGMLTGSNNPEYLACGYSNKNIKIWRNPRIGTEHPDFIAYKAMDKKLLDIATGR